MRVRGIIVILYSSDKHNKCNIYLLTVKTDGILHNNIDLLLQTLSRRGKAYLVSARASVGKKGGGLVSVRAIKEQVIALITDVLFGFDNMFGDVISVLTLAPNSSGDNFIKWDDALVTVTNISGILGGFCLPIVGICLLIELAQVAAKVDLIKWEHGLKVCVKMALTVVFINNVPILLQAIYYKATEWVTNIVAQGPVDSGVGAAAEASLQVTVNAVDNLGAAVILIILATIVWLAIKACGMIVTVIAYARMFEILIYIAISPVPCAFFPLGNGDGGGFSRITAKFLRSFAGVCLHGVMIVICLLLFNAIVGSRLENQIVETVQKYPNPSGTQAISLFGEMCLTVVAGGLVLLMTVTKCGGWAKSVIDG